MCGDLSISACADVDRGVGVLVHPSPLADTPHVDCTSQGRRGWRIFGSRTSVSLCVSVATTVPHASRCAKEVACSATPFLTPMRRRPLIAQASLAGSASLHILAASTSTQHTNPSLFTTCLKRVLVWVERDAQSKDVLPCCHVCQPSEPTNLQLATVTAPQTTTSELAHVSPTHRPAHSRNLLWTTFAS